VKEEQVAASQLESKNLSKLRRRARKDLARYCPSAATAPADCSGSIENQAAIDNRLLSAQRFALARSIGRVRGKRHLQSVMRVVRGEHRSPESIQASEAAAAPHRIMNLLSTGTTGQPPDQPSFLQRSPESGLTRPRVSHSGHTAIQRQAPSDADTSEVDAMIAQVSAECAAFGKYKLSPLDGKSIPGAAARSAGARWNSTVESWMPDYARQKMGPPPHEPAERNGGYVWCGLAHRYGSAFWNYLPEARPQVHHGTQAAKTITEKAIEKIVPTVPVSYTNAFGWAWKRDYTLAAVEINASISASKAKGQKAKAKGGLGGGLLSLDIKGKASADPTPIRYCGGNDFTGVVTVVKTAAKAHLGPAGGALPGLTAVFFHGTPAGDVAFPFISGLTGSISGSKTDAGVDVSIGAGFGKVIGLGETTVTPPPELKEVNQLSSSFREWEVVVGPFNTGEAVVPPVAAGYLDQLHKTVFDFKAQKLDPIAKDLQDQSVDPEKNFQLEFEVVGMASRSWRSASSSTARLKLNEELSQKRAASVETEINNRFSNVRSVRKTGSGAHAVGPSPSGGGVPPMLDDQQAQELYERKKKEAMEEKDPKVRKMLLQAVEANYGPQSDQLAARRVYVFCRWEGVMIMKTLVTVNSSTAP
jgi:hypothetical protein